MKGQKNYLALIQEAGTIITKNVDDVDGLQLFLEATPRTWTFDGQTREIGVIRLGKWKKGDVILVFDGRVTEHWERAGRVLGQSIVAQDVTLQN